MCVPPGKLGGPLRDYQGILCPAPCGDTQGSRLTHMYHILHCLRSLADETGGLGGRSSPMAAGL